MRNIPREIADKYQDFFNMMSQEHGLTLTIEEMDEIIYEALKVHKNQKWISVKDKLPEETVNVAVWVENKVNADWSNYAVGMNENDNWYLINGRKSYEIVTHWMPLPEKPKS